MLLGVVVVFLLCNALALIANLLEVDTETVASLTAHPQHFFGTEIHQLTQTNNLLVTVNRWPVTSQHPVIIYPFHLLYLLYPHPQSLSHPQLSEFYNLLHPWRKVPPSAAQENARLWGPPPEDPFSYAPWGGTLFVLETSIRFYLV